MTNMIEYLLISVAVIAAVVVSWWFWREYKAKRVDQRPISD